jgi:hypothetical protein
MGPSSESRFDGLANGRGVWSQARSNRMTIHCLQAIKKANTHQVQRCTKKMHQLLDIN